MASLQSPVPIDVLPLRAPGRRPPLRGTVLLGRYRVDSERAKTASGVVHEAFDLSAKRRVSVEVATELEPGAAQGRFVREAMVAQRLEGDRVLRVLDTGRLPDGAPFVVREAAVTTLARELEARGTLPIAEAVGFVLDAAEALAEGHALGLSHGRIGLDTILLARDHDGGDLRAKVAWTSSDGHASRDDARSLARDVQDLGRTLATLTSSGGEDGAMTLPAGLSGVVARAVTTGPARFAHVGELAAALAPFAPQGATSARNVAFMLARAGRPQGRAGRVQRGLRELPLKATSPGTPRPTAWHAVVPWPLVLRATLAAAVLIVLGFLVATLFARRPSVNPTLGTTEVRSSAPTTTLADDVTARGLDERSQLMGPPPDSATPAASPSPPASAAPTPPGPPIDLDEEPDAPADEPAEPPGISI